MSHMYSYIIPGPGPGQSGRAPCVKEWENERSMVVDHGTAGAAPHVYTTCCPAWCRTTLPCRSVLRHTNTIHDAQHATSSDLRTGRALTGGLLTPENALTGGLLTPENV